MLQTTSGARLELLIVVLAAALFAAVACTASVEVVGGTNTPSPAPVDGSVPTPTAVPNGATAPQATPTVSSGGAPAPTAAPTPAATVASSNPVPTATPQPGSAIVTVPTATPTPPQTPTPIPTPQPTATPSPTPVPIPPPVASFTLDVSEGQSPLNVRFESTSAGEIASYDWEFGNGLTGITETTGHMYTAAGIYTVTHTVTGPGGSDTFVLDDAITVLPGPAASIEITSNAPNGTAGDSLEFSAMVADEYGNTVDESVIWTVDEAAGSITTAGVFTASTSATRSSTASQTTRGASGTLSTRSSSLATIRRTTLRITGQKANGIRQTL